MIIVVSAKSVNMPVDQRAELISCGSVADPSDVTRIEVKLCGTNARVNLRTSDIVGVELDTLHILHAGKTSIRFNVTQTSRTSYGTFEKAYTSPVQVAAEGEAGQHSETS